MTYAEKFAEGVVAERGSGPREEHHGREGHSDPEEQVGSAHGYRLLQPRRATVLWNIFFGEDGERLGGAGGGVSRWTRCPPRRS